MSLNKKLQEAEYKARIRDEKAQNGGLSELEVNEKIAQANDIIGELEQKTGKVIGLHSKKKFNSKVKFAQMIQQNIFYLIENDYLTAAEKAFLFDVAAIVGFKSNGLVETIDGIQYPLTQEAIAKKIKKTRKHTNKIINDLINKGVVAKSETALENNNVLTYAYFINPNIMFNGDKTEINETLKLIFVKANKKSVLKNLPVKLI